LTGISPAQPPFLFEQLLRFIGPICSPRQPKSVSSERPPLKQTRPAGNLHRDWNLCAGSKPYGQLSGADRYNKSSSCNNLHRFAAKQD